jgi:hypothetical protein
MLVENYFIEEGGSGISAAVRKSMARASTSVARNEIETLTFCTGARYRVSNGRRDPLPPPPIIWITSSIHASYRASRDLKLLM